MRFKHPRTAVILGLVFVAIAAIYWFVSYDAGGTTTLALLGIAMGVGAYALVVGTADDA